MSGTFTIHVTEQVLHDFAALHYKRTRASLLIIIAVAAIVFGTLTRRASMTDGIAPPLWAHVLTVALIAAVLSAVLLILFQISLRRWVRRYFKEQVSLHHPVDVEWDGEGVRTRTPIDQSQRRWTDFVGWRANDRILLLYQSSAFANMFPITDDSAEQIENIKSIVANAGVKKFP